MYSWIWQWSRRYLRWVVKINTYFYYYLLPSPACTLNCTFQKKNSQKTAALVADHSLMTYVTQLLSQLRPCKPKIILKADCLFAFLHHPFSVKNRSKPLLLWNFIFRFDSLVAHFPTAQDIEMLVCRIITYFEGLIW